MTRKLRRMMTYLERLLPIKSHDSLITWSCEKTKTITVSMATKLDMLLTFLERLPPIKLLLWPHVWSHRLARSREKLQLLFLSYQIPMATKLRRMVLYLNRLLVIKSHDTLTSWSFKITWQTKTIISPLSQWL